MLRGELGFQGAVLTDDLSMGGGAGAGDIVIRARLALAAGCDMLPVCNDRAGVLTLLDAADMRAGAGIAIAPRASACDATACRATAALQAS